MNWILRLKNKATLATLIVVTITFVYTLFGLIGVFPSVTQEQVTDIALMVIELLAALGVIIDPTTPGITDSERALQYVSPGVLPEDLEEDHIGWEEFEAENSIEEKEEVEDGSVD